MKKIKYLIKSLIYKINFIFKSDQLLMLKGQELSILNSLRPKINDLHDVEFQVFSQFGDDGIIDYLISNVKISNRYFVEFGVGDYMESNTRFLLMHRNWSGFVMDGSEVNMNLLRESLFFWKYDLHCTSAFITKDNVGQLFADAQVPERIGLLHIDLDGNDYYIWEQLNVVADIVIMEYNSIFGNERNISTIYNGSFARNSSHYSNLYFGASIGALCYLAEKKGYDFIGTNSAGNNAYFILKELNFLNVKSQTDADKRKFREERDSKGNLIKRKGGDSPETIAGMPVYNVITGVIETF